MRDVSPAGVLHQPEREDLYPSRAGQVRAVRARAHPVVWAEAGAQSPLSAECIAAYERDGFLLLQDVFSSEEVSALQDELEYLRLHAASAGGPQLVLEPGSQALRSIFEVHLLSAVFARLAADRRLLGLAAYLLADEVYLHQSRLNYKPGFHGKEFYWHSDFETWHVEDGMPLPRALSISVSLTDNTAHNGPLLVMPGSHQHYVVCEGETPPDNYQMSLRAQEIGVPDDHSLRVLAAAGGVRDTAGPAGSVLVFDSNLMHGSNSNITHLPRSNVFFVYNAVSNALQAPFCAQAPRPDFIARRGEPVALALRDNTLADFLRGA